MINTPVKTANSEDAVLEVRDLEITFNMKRGPVHAVRGVSFALKRGEMLAVVGESGCGKTAMCRTIMRLHAGSAHVKNGSIMLAAEADAGPDAGPLDILSLSDAEMDDIRGRRIAMILQDPMSSLDPTYSVGDQIAEVILRHGSRSGASGGGRSVSKREARAEAVRLLETVGIDDAEKRSKEHPFMFSGGMRQRVAIAVALAAGPDILICDEPTTSLDPGTQEQVMALIGELRRTLGLSVIFITHDIGLVREQADRVLIMKEGKIIESGPCEEIFEDPREEYTKELIFYAGYGKGKSHTHGEIRFRDGVPFHEEGHEHRPLIEVRNVVKSYEKPGREAGRLTVLDGFSMDVGRGEIVGIVGPSGAGKSTLARLVMEMEIPDSGQIRFLEDVRKQMIFQDSVAAFNEHMTIEEIIAEPMMLGASGEKLRKKAALERARSMMDQVGLPAELAARYPYDVSGGQRQRAAIARALITDPDLLVADEPISSLDVPVQSQIVHLIQKLAGERQLTVLLIAHDLPMVMHVADRIVEIS